MSFGRDLCLANSPKVKENTSFGKKLCKAISTEELAKKIWLEIKPDLEEISKTKCEKGCSVIFSGVSSSIVEHIEKLAKNEEIEFCYWYPGSEGHPGGILKNQEIGLIAWDIDSFLCKYPFKVSLIILFVELEDDNVITTIMDTRESI